MRALSLVLGTLILLSSIRCGSARADGCAHGRSTAR
jgi:hypothetical protein